MNGERDKASQKGWELQTRDLVQLKLYNKMLQRNKEVFLEQEEIEKARYIIEIFGDFETFELSCEST